MPAFPPASPPAFLDELESDPFEDLDAAGERCESLSAGPASPRALARQPARTSAGGAVAGAGMTERTNTSTSASTSTSTNTNTNTSAPRPRRARAKPSLKMQAIGYLSRREHSRQELRRKLLAWLRQRERDEAALAAATEAVAREEAQALRDWPSNGIDDAFAPASASDAGGASGASGVPRTDPARRRSRVDASAQASAPRPWAADSQDFAGEDPAADVAGDSPARGIAGRTRGVGGAALSTLRLANGAAIPAALRRALATLEPDPGESTEAPLLPGPAADDEPGSARQARLERDDPEAAVDQLLDWLATQRYLNETRFVESRVNARARKQGTAMIKHELARHGLALEPEQAVALRETEFARAQALWQRKFGEVAADPRLRAKQARFLASRGFASDVVRRIVGGEDED